MRTYHWYETLAVRGKKRPSTVFEDVRGNSGSLSQCLRCPMTLLERVEDGSGRGGRGGGGGCEGGHGGSGGGTGEVNREDGRRRPAGERATVFDDVRATGAFSLATSMPS
jgi:hypothetical protein